MMIIIMENMLVVRDAYNIHLNVIQPWQHKHYAMAFISFIENNKTIFMH